MTYATPENVLMKPAALALALLLTGCEIVMSHPTKSPAEFDRDLYECEIEVAPIRDRDRRVQMTRRCLEQKGWKKDGERLM